MYTDFNGIFFYVCAAVFMNHNFDNKSVRQVCIHKKQQLAVWNFLLETAGFPQSGEDLYLDRDGPGWHGSGALPSLLDPIQYIDPRAQL